MRVISFMLCSIKPFKIKLIIMKQKPEYPIFYMRIFSGAPLLLDPSKRHSHHRQVTFAIRIRQRCHFVKGHSCHLLEDFRNNYASNTWVVVAPPTGCVLKPTDWWHLCWVLTRAEKAPCIPPEDSISSRVATEVTSISHCPWLLNALYFLLFF